MDLIQIIVLALVQGLTEFLPISSSAHLILVPVLTGWKDQGLAFDVAVHIGSLFAVLAYFRHDLRPLLQSWFASFRGQHSAESRLVWGVGVATIPASVVGLLLGDFIDEHLRSAFVIALTTIGFGLALGASDYFGKRQRDEYQMNWTDMLLIGISQALALIPGTSRSGITMTAALALGLTRKAAARFSFLLSIPIILLAGGKKTVDLIKQDLPVDWLALGLGVLLSAVSAYLCIRVFIHALDRIGMWPFVWYRLALGVVLLLWFV